MGYLLMLISAFGVGAAHALEPGHGKTVVAAYLIGSRGRTADAIMLGLIVTATHTASVFLLALGSVIAAAYLVPEQVQRWFTVGSGVLVVGVGLSMIYLRTKHGPPVHPHSHGNHTHSHRNHIHRDFTAEHTHNHKDHRSHVNEYDHEQVHNVQKNTRRRAHLSSLVALGVSGGMVPCPAALLLIPAAVGVGAILKGLLLVVSFSLGLAVVLMGMGLVSLKAAGLSTGWLERKDWARRLSILSAYFITALGLALTAKAFLSPVTGY